MRLISLSLIIAACLPTVTDAQGAIDANGARSYANRIERGGTGRTDVRIVGERVVIQPHE